MIRLGLLALIGIASFVAVYLAMEPRAPQPEAVATADSASSPAVPADARAPADGAPVDGGPAQTTAIGGGTVPPESRMTFALRPAAPATETETKAEAAADEPQPETVASAVRDVTPPGMTAAPRVSGPLVRVQPETPPEPQPQQRKARAERLYNPLVISAGTFKADGGEVRIAGVNVPALETRCGKGSSAWPCGRMARAALRSFIRGRAIECDVPEGATSVPDIATCRVGGEDIGAWLVSTGWAKRSGDRYSKQADAAEKAKLGLWSPARPGDQAEVAASD